MVEGGASGSDLYCLSDAYLEPPVIAVYNPAVLGVYRVLIIGPTAYGGQPGVSL